MLKENKKFIILTIIAVMVLIMVVVGATYAYFTGTNTASGTTATNVSTKPLGNVVVNDPTPNLYLKLSENDMLKDKVGKSYYAISTDTGGKSVHSNVQSNHVLANYKISEGDDSTVYNCKFKLNITKPNLIKEGDMNLELNLINGATINGSTTLNIDLYSVSSSYEVKFNKTGNGEGNLVTGDIKFNNTNIEQDYLEGETLNTIISLSDLDCEYGASEEVILFEWNKEDGVIETQQIDGQTFYKISNESIQKETLLTANYLFDYGSDGIIVNGYFAEDNDAIQVMDGLRYSGNELNAELIIVPSDGLYNISGVGIQLSSGVYVDDIVYSTTEYIKIFTATNILPNNYELFAEYNSETEILEEFTLNSSRYL